MSRRGGGGSAVSATLRRCDAAGADEPDGGGTCRDGGMAIANAVCAMQVGFA